MLKTGAIHLLPNWAFVPCYSESLHFKLMTSSACINELSFGAVIDI